MGLFKKKADPIAECSRALTARIATLQSQIKQLDQQAETEDRPRIRSTAYPVEAPRRTIQPHNGEPIFERVDQKQLKERPEPLTTSRHFNELGAAKYNLVALME